MSVRAVLRQPLLYFTLAGVVVFLVDAGLRRDSEVVHITDGVRREVASELTTTFQRAPTEQELEQGIQAWAETELLFREASELGLAENDAVVRTHLARKLSQMVAQRTIAEAPTESELRAELKAHRERYARPDRFTVSHAFVNRAVAVGTYASRSEQVLGQLNSGADLRQVGDHFPRGPVFERLPLAQLEAALNVKLGSALVPERRGQWQKFSSARGAHFVRLDELVSGEPTLENARDALVESVTVRKKDAAVRAFVEELRAKFTIIDESKP